MSFWLTRYRKLSGSKLRRGTRIRFMRWVVARARVKCGLVEVASQSGGDIAYSRAWLCSAANAWTSFVMTRSSKGCFGSLTSQSATKHRTLRVYKSHTPDEKDRG